MKLKKNLQSSCVIAAFLLTACGGQNNASLDTKNRPTPWPAAAKIASLKTKNVLVFSKTAGWRHGSIEAGQDMFQELSDSYGFNATFTEEASTFTDKGLASFDAIVFLNTTGDVLAPRQERAMERFIQSGGGYVGIHAATDTESKGWDWYVNLSGAIFNGHPGDPSNLQRARMTVVDSDHASTQNVPQKFDFLDEWYDFKNINPNIRPLIEIDRNSYTGAKAKGREAISWYQDYDGGRSFYTNLGHKKASFQDPVFVNHIIGGLTYAVGTEKRTDSLAFRPDTDRFKTTNLTGPLNEPLSMDVMHDGSILFIERIGGVKRWTKSKGIEELGTVPNIYRENEFGLIGLAGYPVKGPLEGIFLMYNVKLEDRVLQRVSYMPLTNGTLDASKMVDYFDMPNEDICCHTGGAVRFGPDGYLYIATGDNSTPFNLNGIAPLSPTDIARDARRSSGNTKDLRGKILRISPKLDGTYTIPEGNLFKDTEIGRPEIYVMGARNPYTIGFDSQEGTLFYGDVGPDAHQDNAKRGSRGYDEINRVTKAGNFGWPFFIGDNSPYRIIDAVTGDSGKFYDPLKPVNDSPRNTGSKTLPPAQPALIWYPYVPSETFPEMGQGGRNALAGGIYRQAGATKSTGAWPAYFEGKLIISDFIRRHLKIVTIDEAGRAGKIESVAEDAGITSPLDLEFGPDGALYVMNYGTVWHGQSDDSNITKIEFLGSGNRTPLMQVGLDRTAGGAPFTIQASTKGTFDPEGDDLKIEWAVAEIERGTLLNDLADLFGTASASGESTELTIQEPGHYAVIAKATDQDDGVSYKAEKVDVGNEPPSVDIAVMGNTSFYWPERSKLTYQVIAEDVEDGTSSQSPNMRTRLSATAKSFEQTKPVAEIIGHQETQPSAIGLLAENNCMTCHQMESESVGPAYKQVAERYADRDDKRAYLESALLKGSSGVWGEHQMPAHDYLDENVRGTMIDYILSLHDGSKPIDIKGPLTMASVVKAPDLLEIKARYIDVGTDDAPPLEVNTTLLLQPNTLDLSVYAPWQGVIDGKNRVWMDEGKMGIGLKSEGRFINVGKLDLTDVKDLSVIYHDGKIWSKGKVEIEIRSGSATGDIIARGRLEPKSSEADQWRSKTLPLDYTAALQGKHDLYVVSQGLPGAEETHTAVLSGLTFEF